MVQVIMDDETSNTKIIFEFMQGIITTLRSDGDIDHWPTDREEIKALVNKYASGLLEYHFPISSSGRKGLYDDLVALYQQYVNMDSRITFIDDEMLEKMASVGEEDEDE